jgi:poly(3-hydroxybutyrate) depolymerase
MKEPGFIQGAVSKCDFESMQTSPAPEHLIEKRAEIVSGMSNVWYEYVPAGYDIRKKHPLIVQLHGGGMDGKRWTNMTVWHLLADEYGLIVIYPNSPDYQAWKLNERDVQYLYDLIVRVCGEYSIDRSRIYMQGMSNGDQMTLAFAMKHPEVLAAAGFATGPTAPELFEENERPVVPLPVIQMRGEKDVLYFHETDNSEQDVYADRYSMNDLNRKIWEDVNGLDLLPSLSIQGKDNFLFYKGRNADLINWEVRDMGHREPPCEAQVFWDYLYSGRARVDGAIADTGVRRPLTGAEDTVVISLGSGMLFKKNITVVMSADKNAVARYFEPGSATGFGLVGLGEMLETGALYAPAEFFAAAYNAKVEYPEIGRALVTFADGEAALFYAETSLVRYMGGYRSMKKPSLLLCGAFYIPVGEFCEDMMGLCVSEADDCMLISKAQAQLGRYTARILRGILGGQRRPPAHK